MPSQDTANCSARHQRLLAIDPDDMLRPDQTFVHLSQSIFNGNAQIFKGIFEYIGQRIIKLIHK